MAEPAGQGTKHALAPPMAWGCYNPRQIARTEAEFALRIPLRPAGREVSMDIYRDPLILLVVAWGVVTAILIVFLIYRSSLSTREEDQIFLGSAAEGLASEQRVLVARIEKLSVPITSLIVLSSALLAATIGVWLWQAFKSF